MTPGSVVVGYKRFSGLCCLHLQGEVTDDGRNDHRYKPGAIQAYIYSLLQHYTASQSRIFTAMKTTNKHSLRSNTKGYRGNTD